MLALILPVLTSYLRYVSQVCVYKYANIYINRYKPHMLITAAKANAPYSPKFGKVAIEMNGYFVDYFQCVVYCYAFQLRNDEMERERERAK